VDRYLNTTDFNGNPETADCIETIITAIKCQPTKNGKMIQAYLDQLTPLDRFTSLTVCIPKDT